MGYDLNRYPTVGITESTRTISLIDIARQRVEELRRALAEAEAELGALEQRQFYRHSLR